MQGAPAQLVAGCQFWIFLANILGMVVAPGPKQPMVCSCQDQCWAPHTVPAEISIICFFLCGCHDVQSLSGLAHAKAQQVSSAWPSCALPGTILCFSWNTTLKDTLFVILEVLVMAYDHQGLPDHSTEGTRCGIAVSLTQTPSSTLSITQVPSDFSYLWIFLPFIYQLIEKPGLPGLNIFCL